MQFNGSVGVFKLPASNRLYQVYVLLALPRYSLLFFIALTMLFCVLDDRFQNVRITVGDSNPPTGLCIYVPGKQGAWHKYDCKGPIYGRYVRITQEHHEYMNLVEATVTGF